MKKKYRYIKTDEIPSGKAAEITASKREDNREKHSVIRQILDVQALIRETEGEGKTEWAA